MTSLDNLRRDAKALKRAFAAGGAEAQARVTAVLGERDGLTHADALHILAREQGHDSWPRLKLATETAAMDRAARADRLKHALMQGQDWVVEALLAADPGLGRANLGLACALFDLPHVQAVLARDPGAATRPVAGPRVPLLHLCASRHRGAGSVAVAQALVAAGADVNCAMPDQPGSGHLLSALYFALGHAGNLPLAEWLLAQGADPDDDESLYHATELGHLDGVRLLLRHGVRITGTNALPRMLDFNDLEGVRLLLEAGADPNEGIGPHPSGEPAMVIPSLHQAARRGCSAAIAQLLLDHGADIRARYKGHTAYAYARLYANHPVARVIQAAGQPEPLDPAEALLAATADGPVQGRIAEEALTPETRRLLLRVLGGPHDLARVERLIDVGLNPDWTDEMGMTALHVAGWNGFAETVTYLLTLGPDLTRKNDYGGDALGTILHGAENNPDRAARDHLGCARAVLAAGAPIHHHDIEVCGLPEFVALLETWAAAHPERVIPRPGI